MQAQPACPVSYLLSLSTSGRSFCLQALSLRIWGPDASSFLTGASTDISLGHWTSILCCLDILGAPKARLTHGANESCNGLPPPQPSSALSGSGEESLVWGGLLPEATPARPWPEPPALFCQVYGGLMALSLPYDVWPMVSCQQLLFPEAQPGRPGRVRRGNWAGPGWPPSSPAPIYLWEFICPQARLAHSPSPARGQEQL